MAGHEAKDAGAPAQRWQWLRPFIPKRVQPYLRGLRKRAQRIGSKLDEPYRTVFPFTQAHMVRQQNLVALGREMDARGVPGALVECGVLDGGTAALLAWASDGSRQIHLFDAWEGLPATTSEDGAAASAWTGEVVGSPTRVLSVMRLLNVARERIVIHRGWFDQTFPTADVPSVAVLHVDCDFYEPTRLCLSKWYPVLSPGGVMQFDDYDAFQGCRQAVDEFLAAHPELRLETVGTGAKAYIIRKPASGDAAR